MPASECSFDGLRFCLNFAYTRGALGATGMLFSGEFFCGMSQEATTDAPAKVILAQDSTHESGRRYTFGCIIDKKQGTLYPRIRDQRVPYL
jgi:hypothetical protein